MATWDTGMPLDFSDGTTVDEGDLDPIVKNLDTLRYSTVFECGVRRMTTVNSASTTELEFMRTPSIVMENGYLYKVEGQVFFRPGGSTAYPQVNVHQGAGLAGANELQMIYPPTSGPTGVNIPFPFSKYLKSVSQHSQIFTVGVFRAGGTGSIDFQADSWIAVLRSGEVSRMVDGS